MDLFEYQAKELFAAYGVPVQPGKVAATAEEARAIAALNIRTLRRSMTWARTTS